jgi:putative transposase
LEYKGDLYGTHVEQVEPEGTTKECPSCGFETDRDANAAMNVLQRGFSELGLGWPESTPVEAALPADTDDFREVSAKRVVETGRLPS